MEAQCGFTAVTRSSLRSDRVLRCSALPYIYKTRADDLQALNLYSILGELSSILAENFKVFQDPKSRIQDSVMYIKYTIIFSERIN